MGSPSVLVVSQWSILSHGLRRALSAAWPDADVVVVDGALEALAAASTRRFDLVVAQQDLAGVSGAVACHLVRAASPETVAVLLVERATDAVTVTAIAHGVAALVPAGSSGPGLVGIARQALAGARPLDAVLLRRPDLAAAMFDDVRSAAFDGTVSPVGLRALPAVEVAILDGLLRGLPEPAIAAVLPTAGGPVAADLTRMLAHLAATLPANEPALAAA